MTKPQPVQARYLRDCGYLCLRCKKLFKKKGKCPRCNGTSIKHLSHPADQTLELKSLDDVINVYCLGCLIDAVGLKPIERYRLKVKGETVELISLPLGDTK